MKKIFNIKLLALALSFSSVAYVSCNDDDLNLGKKEKPVLTSEVTNHTVKEGDIVTLNFTLSKAINKPVQYRLVMLEESTATDQEDYVIPGCRSNDPDCVAIEENGGPVGYIFEIPAYATEYSLDINIPSDVLVEGVETLKLKAIPNRTLLGTVDNLIFDINIEDSSDLIIDLNWSGTFDNSGTPTDFCELDMDLELYDPNGDLIATSYTNCPEQIIIPVSAPDGTYWLDASLWTTSGYSQPINIPANVIFNKPGIALSQTFDASSYFPMANGGFLEGNNDYLISFEIIKTGHTFTINDPDGATVFQGRIAKNIANKRALKMKRR